MKTNTHADFKDSYSVETYALYNNVDSSILKLNPTIKKFGYEFIAINIPNFEKNFSSLVSLPKNFESEHIIQFDNENKISIEFHNLILHHQHFGHSVLRKNEIILLKCSENFEQIVDNNSISYSATINILADLQDFNNNLIQQLRLYKNGDIFSPLEFQIASESRKVTCKSWRGRKTIGHLEFDLTDNDVKILNNTLSAKFTGTPLTELAINNFNLAYEIADPKTKFITLMTCLESLMNLGTHQITHTVSRHLSLIISKSESEFVVNYARIKKLYDIRSSIVHTGKTDADITAVTNELQDKVRHAINYCLPLNIDKSKLFEKFNSLGYGM
jgi:hypothetical protein